MTQPFRAFLIEGYTPRFSRSDIRHSVNRREMLWIRKKAFTIAARQWVATVMALSAVFALTLLPFTRPIAISVGGSSAGVQATLIGSSALFLIGACVWWHRVYRGVIPGLLLQIDRCGFCGNGLASRGKRTGAKALQVKSAICTECGAEWAPAMRIGFAEGSMCDRRHAA